jgi:hypothetical protein
VAGGGVLVRSSTITIEKRGTLRFGYLALDPTDDKRLWGVTKEVRSLVDYVFVVFMRFAQGGVHVSTDSAATWTQVTGLPIAASIAYRGLAVIEQDYIAVGSTVGVFISHRSAPTVWQTLGSGLPNVLVWDMVC